MKQCDVREATHVSRDGIERLKITSKWGIRPDGSLKPPSQGGFGVFTESGERIGMTRAHSYWRDDHESFKELELCKRILKTWMHAQPSPDGSAPPSSYWAEVLVRKWREISEREITADTPDIEPVKQARVRRILPPGGEWVEVTIIMESPNGKSLMVTAPEGLGTGSSIALLGGQMMLTLRRDEYVRGVEFTDIFSGSRWELERPNEIDG